MAELPAKIAAPKEPLTVPTGNRSLPHNVEAERNVLGSILLDSASLPKCLELLVPEDFYVPAHGTVFRAMLDLDTEGDHISEATLAKHLADQRQLDSVGGVSYLAMLLDGSTSPANVGFFARIVHDLSRVRKFINQHDSLVAMAMQPGTQISKLLDAAEQVNIEFYKEQHTSDFSAIGSIITQSLAQLKEDEDNPNRTRSTRTGIESFDSLTTGFKGGELVILAARPSVGKTAFSLQVARHAAMYEGVAIGIFSLEMSQRSLVMRMLSAEAGVSAQSMRTRRLHKDDWRRLLDAGSRLSQTHILIDDSSGTNIAELRGKAKRMAQRQEREKRPRLGLIVVDYLQLLTLPEYRMNGRRSDGRQQEIAEISRALKLLSTELDVPVLCLSQLNRSIENRPDATPRLADLRESGAIEQDADIVVFLSRYKPEGDAPDPQLGGFRQPLSLVIAKQRNGPTGTVNLVFDKEVQHFGEMDGNRGGDDL